MKRSITTILHTLCRPVHWMTEHVPHPVWLKKHHVHAFAGVGVMFAGVLIAKAPVAGFAHLVADVVGYSFHAVGLAPVLRLFGAE